MPGSYLYVGPRELLATATDGLRRARIRCEADLLCWMHQNSELPPTGGLITVTFVIDTSRRLWIADRRSEHVQCAAGEPVLSAGEMTFEIRKGHASVLVVTNQSTGYCPEPESWPAVAAALDRVGIPHPRQFTSEFLFRRCLRCGTINIVKDRIFECAVCSEPLSEHWNLSSAPEPLLQPVSEPL